ncbi:potassium channel family protein [Niveibacterium sp. SC-1]|uniref:potassium channel family protein n=1 Tax=Niveibacterium sp. SC-1 TaxID=3135646 RepID=UPI00311F9909
MDPRTVRRRFARGLLYEMQVVWPIVSGLLVLIVGLGVVVGIREGWDIGDAIYFAFITGLTIGYGDFVPHTALTRILAVCIGLCGFLLTALIAAVTVAALTRARSEETP